MHNLAVAFLSAKDPTAAHGGGIEEVSSLFPVGAEVQRIPVLMPTVGSSSQEQVLSVSDHTPKTNTTTTEWLPRTRTVPWGPLATWNPARTIEVSCCLRR